MIVELGDIVHYDTHFGRDRRVRVTGFDEELGRKVFMGVTTSGHEKVWGYLSQITKNIGQPSYEIEK